MQKPTRFRQALRRRHRALGLPAPRPMDTPHGRSLAVATGDVTIIRTICPPKVQRWLGLEASPRAVETNPQTPGKSTSPDIPESAIVSHDMAHGQTREHRKRLAPFLRGVRRA